MDEFSIFPSLESWMMHAFISLMETLGIVPILRRYVQAYPHLTIFMVAARLTEPSFDLVLSDLAGGVYYPWSTPNLDDDNLYSTLGRLISSNDEMEMYIIKALKHITGKYFHKNMVWNSSFELVSKRYETHTRKVICLMF